MGTFLVVGGSSGIGASLVSQLAKAGHTVHATYHTHKQDSGSGDVQYHPLDVTSSELNLDFLPDALEGVAYCPGSIDLKPFQRIGADDYMEDFRLNVLGGIRVLQEVMPKLKAAKQGSVVFFSTVAVQRGFPFHAKVSASKGALEGLARALAAELAPTVRVNCVAPSLTDTPMAESLLNTDQKQEANAQRHPLRRVGTPEDIASMAAFLLSEESSWITGQVLPVDGGISSLKV